MENGGPRTPLCTGDDLIGVTAEPVDAILYVHARRADRSVPGLDLTIGHGMISFDMGIMPRPGEFAYAFSIFTAQALARRFLTAGLWR